MGIRVKEYKYLEKKGYYKVVLDNGDKLNLTKREMSELKIKDSHEHLLFESTSGKWYKPYTVADEVHFMES